MDSNQARSFESVADAYERFRPQYPPELYADLFSLAAMVEASRVLEIGCGTGIATVELARRGFSVLGLEPGRRLSQIARNAVQTFENCSILETTFEDWDLDAEDFDTVVCAQAFHWLDPDSRLTRIASVLTQGGNVAIFGNAILDLDPKYAEPVRAAYQQHAPFLDGSSPTMWYAEGGPVRELLVESRLFGRPETRYYSWSTRYSTDDYVGMLATHSDHIALSPAVQEQLLGAIRVIVDGLGGRIEVQYQSSLSVAARTP